VPSHKTEDPSKGEAKELLYAQKTTKRKNPPGDSNEVVNKLGEYIKQEGVQNLSVRNSQRKKKDDGYGFLAGMTTAVVGLWTSL